MVPRLFKVKYFLQSVYVKDVRKTYKLKGTFLLTENAHKCNTNIKVQSCPVV